MKTEEPAIRIGHLCYPSMMKKKLHYNNKIFDSC